MYLNLVANTYKVTYKVEYSGKTEYLSNTIVIKANEAPPPEEPEQNEEQQEENTDN